MRTQIKRGAKSTHRGDECPHECPHESKKAAFLAAYAATCAVTKAADAAGMNRALHYDWMESDPEYKAKLTRRYGALPTVLKSPSQWRQAEVIRAVPAAPSAPKCNSA